MEFACGGFAEDEPALADLALGSAPKFVAGKGDEDAMPMDIGPEDPASLLAQNNPPSYSSLGSGGYPGGGYPFGGASTAPLIPGGGGKSGTDGSGTPGTTNFPPTAEAPEPAGMVLMATGLIGVAGMIRRRVGSRG
jgi:hypothetical protein